MSNHTGFCHFLKFLVSKDYVTLSCRSPVFVVEMSFFTDSLWVYIIDLLKVEKEVKTTDSVVVVR